MRCFTTSVIVDGENTVRLLTFLCCQYERYFCVPVEQVEDGVSELDADVTDTADEIRRDVVVTARACDMKYGVTSGWVPPGKVTSTLQHDCGHLY